MHARRMRRCIEQIGQPQQRRGDPRTVKAVFRAACAPTIAAFADADRIGIQVR